MANGILEFILEAAQNRRTLINEFLIACQEAMKAEDQPNPQSPEQSLQNWFYNRGYTEVSGETCKQLLEYRASTIASGAPDAY